MSSSADPSADLVTVLSSTPSDIPISEPSNVPYLDQSYNPTEEPRSFPLCPDLVPSIGPSEDPCAVLSSHNSEITLNEPSILTYLDPSED